MKKVTMMVMAAVLYRPSDNFKEIIISVLKDGIEFEDFKNRMQPLFDKYEIKKGKIPDLYSLLLWNKGLDIF